MPEPVAATMTSISRAIATAHRPSFPEERFLLAFLMVVSHLSTPAARSVQDWSGLEPVSHVEPSLAPAMVQGLTAMHLTGRPRVSVVTESNGPPLGDLRTVDEDPVVVRTGRCPQGPRLIEAVVAGTRAHLRGLWMRRRRTDQ